MNNKLRLLILLLSLPMALVVAGVFASSPAMASDDGALVPQNLLGLVHAPEVHRELGLSAEQIKQLEELFAKIDGEWFRARVEQPQKQYEIIAGLEAQVLQWFEQHATAEQRARLTQLELQSLGARMLLRPGVASELGLAAAQQAKLLELAQAVDAARQALQQATLKNEAVDEAQETLAAAMQAEQKAFQRVVQPEQLKKLRQLVGDPFSTLQLTRIYPMAPEFVPVENWINSGPLSLKELRGKVVVVHFYAFQCHNCHANFEHYAKWSEEFSSEEVVVIGIQTPETARERDADAVRAAAEERGLQYPVLIDLESKNWKSWANTMWPTVYVIDKQGYLRHWWQGELKWQGATGDQTIRDLIVRLMEEP